MIKFLMNIFYFIRGLWYCVIIGFYRIAYAIVNFRLKRRLKKLERLLDEKHDLLNEIDRHHWRKLGEREYLDSEKFDENS